MAVDEKGEFDSRVTQNNALEKEVDDAEVPRVPRPRLRASISLPSVVRIGTFGTLLFAVLVLGKPCAEGVSRFVIGFDPSDAAVPETLDERYPGYKLMTPDEAMEYFYGDGGALLIEDATPAATVP